MVILITGITSGFGRAMAARLSADGHKVYGTHRKATDLLPGVTYIKADAQRAEDCEAAVEMAVKGRSADDFVKKLPQFLSILADCNRRDEKV